MENVNTKYGVLKDAILAGRYKSGEPEDYKVDCLSILKVGEETFIPLFGDVELRRKELPQVKFYKNGNIKSIALKNRTKITTNIGVYEVEKVTFYEDGSVKRLFPLDGRLTGYWTEENEFDLAEVSEFDFPFGSFKAKVMSFNFYKNKNLKSLTFWPKERVELNLKDSKIKIRTGVSLYESGNIASCEPAVATKIETPIGVIEAYDKNIIGIHGDQNSLKFYEDGSIKSMITSTNIIKVHNKDGQVTVYSPREVILFASSEILDTITVLLEFDGDKVIIDKDNEYNIKENTFNISSYGEQKLTLVGDMFG